jgi:hypothetical protein
MASLSSFDLVVASAEFDSLVQSAALAGTCRMSNSGKLLPIVFDPLFVSHVLVVISSKLCTLMTGSSLLRTIDSMPAGATSTITTTPTFEPVLNVPALIIFLGITLVFGFLQFRVAAIGSAVDRRTQALQRLRSVKAKQLSGDLVLLDTNKKSDTNDSDIDKQNEATTNNTNGLVQAATDEYRQALEEVEHLRTIIPGIVRIAAPPVATAIMEENMAAAKQFLGIDLESRSLARGEEEKVDKKKTANDSSVEEEQQQKNLNPVLIAVLVAVGISQIGLLYLLSFDPMMPSSNVLP